MAHIGFVTLARGVIASIGQIKSGGVTKIICTQVIVIAEISTNFCENTANSRIARIISAGILIIARSNGIIGTLSKSYVSGVLAHIKGTSIFVVTLTVVETIRNGRTKIGKVYHTGGGITDIHGAGIIGRDRI
jgi:hypothetical protein